MLLKKEQIELKDKKYDAYEDSKDNSEFSIVVRPNTQQEGNFVKSNSK